MEFPTMLFTIFHRLHKMVECGTFHQQHFMRILTTHMMYDRMAPEEPIKAPTMVMRLLFIIKPSAHRAHPEYELSTVITTGMSAPEIGNNITYLHVSLF